MEITAGEEEKNLRIDRYLRKIIRTIPLSEIYQLIKSGDILVNSRRVKPDYRLTPGDKIYIPFEPDEREEVSIPENLINSLEIIFEDDSLICVNKPSGIPIHSGSGWNFGVKDILQKKIDSTIYPIHRLDRDTSGVLLFARKRTVARTLTDQFKKHKVRKIYIALVKGAVKSEGSIRLPLLKRKKGVTVEEEGKEALTRFFPIQSFSCCTLLRIEILTGRTHQIRVHMNYTGHPLAGDWRYGEREFNIRMKKQGLKRLFLHAEVIDITHPVTQKLLKLQAPLPYDLKQFLKKLS